MCSVLSCGNRWCVSSADGEGGDIFGVWARNAISPTSLTRKEKSFYLSRSTLCSAEDISLYIYKKRPIYLQRDLYIWTETYFYLSTSENMTPYLHTYMKRDLYFWKKKYISEKRPVPMKSNVPICLILIARKDLDLFLPEQNDSMSQHIYEKRPIYLESDQNP